MRSGHRSYRKTCLLAGSVTVGVCVSEVLSERLLPGSIQQLVGALAWAVCLIAATVTVSGLIVLWRNLTLAGGREDLFLRLNRSRSEERLAGGEPGRLRRWITAAWPGRSRHFRVGDEVEILPLTEIQRTLDADGALEGLPFQPEMVAFCGRRFRVYRRVDKIYDYGRTSKMRRLKSAVSLIGLRCDGSAHGACQAQCYLIWKEAWLRPVSRSARRPAPSRAAVVTAPAASRASASVASGGCDRADRPAAPTRPAQPQTQFRCQFTQLAAASLPMRGWDIRQDLRPLIAGNVTLLAFGMAMLTRLFNRIQMLRHGVPFPSAFPSESTGSVPAATFEPGERVRVRPAPDIASTLDARGRNRGLWFDLDMLKYCDHSYEVAGRVERVIDAATGRMLHMKTSCLTLEGVTSSGEFLRFCPQHEQIFWREIWLRPVDRKHEVPQA